MPPPRRWVAKVTCWKPMILMQPPQSWKRQAKAWEDWTRWPVWRVHPSQANHHDFSARIRRDHPSKFDHSILGDRAAIRLLTDGGSIVLMSSAAASMGLPNHEAIAAAKGGVEGLVRSRLRPTPAKAFESTPSRQAGGYSVGFQNHRFRTDVGAFQEHAPLGQIGAPEDVANMLTFLLDPTNSWITGKPLGLMVASPRSALDNQPPCVFDQWGFRNDWRLTKTSGARTRRSHARATRINRTGISWHPGCPRGSSRLGRSRCGGALAGQGLLIEDGPPPERTLC